MTEHDPHVEAPNSAKLVEAIIYVAKRSATDPHFGLVKLNKILFCADFNHYARTGKTITGYRYRRYPKGPALDQWFEIKQELHRGYYPLRIETRQRGTHEQQRIVALRRHKRRSLSRAEMATLRRMIKRFSKMTATQMIDLSHGFLGWQSARPYEVIPLETVYLSSQKFTDKELAYGRRYTASLQPA